MPAVLTLLGSVAIYTIGAKGVKEQSGISALLVCFAMTFLIGTVLGAGVRLHYETGLQAPSYLAKRDFAIQRLKLPVEMQRLDNLR